MQYVITKIPQDIEVPNEHEIKVSLTEEESNAQVTIKQKNAKKILDIVTKDHSMSWGGSKSIKVITVVSSEETVIEVS